MQILQKYKAVKSKIRNRILAIFLIAAVVPILTIGCISIVRLRSQMQDHYDKQLSAEAIRANSVLFDITTSIYTASEPLVSSNQWRHLFGSQKKIHSLNKYYLDFTSDVSTLKNNTAAISTIQVYTDNPNIPGNSFIRQIPTLESQDWYSVFADKGWNHWGCVSSTRHRQNYYELALVRRIVTLTGKYEACLVVQLDFNNLKNRMDQSDYTIISSVNHYPVFYSNQEAFLRNAFPFQGEYSQDFYTYHGAIRLEGKNQLSRIVSFRPYGTKDMFYICVSAPDAYSSMKSVSSSYCFIILISIVVPMMIVLLFLSVFSNRLAALKHAMHQASEGDYNIIEDLKGDDELNEVFTNLKRTVQLIHQKDAEIYTAQLNEQILANKQQQMEFKMLASQINPHFLYNTLETIRMQSLSAGNRDVARSIKLLGKAMHYVLENSGTNSTTLGRELSYIETYLEIQKLRFEDRFTCEIVVDDGIQTDNYQILPLLLQPIVENAVVHGLESVSEQGYAQIHISIINDELWITVQDNGCGIDPQTLARIQKNINEHNPEDFKSIGLYNINQRIRLRYGDEYGLQIESSENTGTTVTLCLPAQNISS